MTVTYYILKRLIYVLVAFIAICLWPEDKKERDEEKEEKTIVQKVKDRILLTLHDYRILLLCMVIFVVFISPAQVASASMEPTLMTGDFTIMTNTIGGYHPECGDIIAFAHNDQVWTKRVIGLPGDVVEIHDGNVYINGTELDEGYLPEDCLTYPASVMYQTGDTFYVPEGCLFVMGDNRENSFDSRYWQDPYVKVSDVIAEYRISLFNAPVIFRTSEE